MSTASRQEYRVAFTQQYAAKHTNIYFRLDHTQVLFTSLLPIGPHTTETMYFPWPILSIDFLLQFETHTSRDCLLPTHNRDCLLPR